MNECAVCSLGKKTDGEANDNNNDSDVECPASKQDPKKRYCWSRTVCQKSKLTFCLNVLDSDQ